MTKDKNQQSSEMQHLLELFAHKVKNPVHSIGINLDVVKTKVNRKLGEKAADIQNHLEILTADVARLQQIVQEFSAFIAPLETKRKKVAVEQILQDALQEINYRFPGRQSQVKLDMEPKLSKIPVNRRQVVEAVVELLVNAIEAGGNQNPVFVQAQQKTGKVYLSINDNGEGIPAKELKKVFDLFYTTKQGRLGFGLPKAKKLVEWNDGSLNVKSKIKKGTEISLVFRV